MRILRQYVLNCYGKIRIKKIIKYVSFAFDLELKVALNMFYNERMCEVHFSVNWAKYIFG